MDIQAEIVSSTTSAPMVRRLSGIVAMVDAGEASRIALQLRESDVLQYQRQGNDLVLALPKGQEIVLLDFFERNGRHPDLALIDAEKDAFVHVRLPGDEPPGVLQTSDAHDASEAGLLGAPLIAASLFGGGVLLAAVTSGRSSDDNKPPATQAPDSAASDIAVEAEPSHATANSDGADAAGRAQPAATIAGPAETAAQASDDGPLSDGGIALDYSAFEPDAGTGFDSADLAGTNIGRLLMAGEDVARMLNMSRMIEMSGVEGEGSDARPAPLADHTVPDPYTSPAGALPLAEESGAVSFI